MLASSYGKLVALGLSAAGTLAGCGAINRTRPHDMTAADHEEAALTQDAAAEESAAAARTPGRGAAYQRTMTLRHLAFAQDHRAAARVLRDEEARACRNLPPGLAATPPLARFAVAGSSPLREPAGGRGYVRGDFPLRLRGAVLSLTNAGSAPRDELTRHVECRLAHAAAVGGDGDDPLAVPGASARVLPGGAVVALVEIRAEHKNWAAEVWRRAQLLARAR